MARRLRDRYIPDVEAAVKVAYGPQLAALAEMLLQAKHTRDTALDAATTSQRGIELATKAAQPLLNSIYARGGNVLDEAAGALAKTTGAVPPTLAAEQAGAKSRLAEAQTAAETDLAVRGVQASATGAYQRGKALQDYSDTAGAINRRGQSLQGEMGAYATNELNKLLEGARGRSVTRRGQDLAAEGRKAATEVQRQSLDERIRSDRAREDIAREKARNKGGGGGKSSFTPVQRRNTARTIRNGVATLEQLGLPKTADGAQAAKHVLLFGLKTKPKRGEGAAQPIAKGVTSDQFLADAIWERYQYGGVSAQTNRKLRKQYGISAKQLSAPKQHVLPSYPH